MSVILSVRVTVNCDGSLPEVKSIAGGICIVICEGRSYLVVT